MSGQTMEFPTDQIISVMTGRWFSESGESIVFLLEFILCRNLRKEDLKEALPIAASVIAEQLEWTRGIEDSFAAFQGNPEEWLELQISEHGKSHQLSEDLPSQVSEVTEWAPIDPLSSVRQLSEDEGKLLLIEEANRSHHDWSDVNDINNSAVDAVEMLMRLAVGGDDSAIEMLRNLAIGITRHLHTHHSDSMRFASEFPAVLSAGNENRWEELAAYKLLPIGQFVGFPHRPGKKTGAALDKSPAGFWREVQFCLGVIRGMVLLSASATIPVKMSIDLKKRIAALPDFGSGEREAWFENACSLVEENSHLIPQWIWDRASAGECQRGLPSEWTQQLRKGLGYCWPEA